MCKTTHVCCCKGGFEQCVRVGVLTRSIMSAVRVLEVLRNAVIPPTIFSSFSLMGWISAVI